MYANVFDANVLMDSIDFMEQIKNESSYLFWYIKIHTCYSCDKINNMYDS